jgi:hypothetical protein
VTNKETRKWSNIGVWALLNIFALMCFLFAYIASRWIQMKYIEKKEVLYKGFLDAQAALKEKRSQKEQRSQRASKTRFDEEGAKVQDDDNISIEKNLQNIEFRGMNKVYPDPNKKSYGPMSPIKIPGQNPNRNQVMPIVQFGPMDLNESLNAKEIDGNNLLLSGRARQSKKSLQSSLGDKNVSQWDLDANNLNRVVSQKGIYSDFDSRIEIQSDRLSSGLSAEMEVKIQNQLKTATGHKTAVESQYAISAKTKVRKDEDMRHEETNESTEKPREGPAERDAQNQSPSKVRGILKNREENWRPAPDRVMAGDGGTGAPVGKGLKVSKKVDLEGTNEGTFEEGSLSVNNKDKDKVEGHSIVKKEIGSKNHK